MKKPQLLHLKNSQSLQKTLNLKNFLHEKISIPPLQIEQFKTLPEKKQSPENSYPLPLPRNNCLTITETTSNNRTKSQPLVKKYQAPTKKHFNLPKKFSIPLKFLNP